ncbi:MAG: cation transporter [Lachnospiraceae bacterium]|nr:cation transporter [Lachnospiraceae bacterium]
MYKTTMKIDGMMCGMCEAHINDAIRSAIPGAKKVKSSHGNGECSFVSENKPEEAKIREVIEKTGYTLISVSSEISEKRLWGRK